MSKSESVEFLNRGTQLYVDDNLGFFFALLVGLITNCWANHELHFQAENEDDDSKKTFPEPCKLIMLI